MWLIFGTTAYVRETGDFGILDEKVPWDNEPGTEVPLMELLRISFNHVVENLGPHRLPLIGRADWNDCLNLNCFSWDPDESFQTAGNVTEGSKAESLMIAGLFVFCGRQYAELCRARGMEAEAERAEACVADMVEAVKESGRDGEWYLRAYDFNGNSHVDVRDTCMGHRFRPHDGRHLRPHRHALGALTSSPAGNEDIEAKVESLLNRMTLEEKVRLSYAQSRKADYVIYVGGLNKNHAQDCEGGDREHYQLPFGQDRLISELMAANRNTVLVIVSGNAYDMPWRNKVPKVSKACWMECLVCRNLILILEQNALKQGLKLLKYRF